MSAKLAAAAVAVKKINITQKGGEELKSKTTFHDAS